jgi:hypothetical protein
MREEDVANFVRFLLIKLKRAKIEREIWFEGCTASFMLFSHYPDKIE